MNTLSGIINTTNTNLASLSGNLNTTNTNLSTLSGTVSTLSGNVSTLNATVVTLSGVVAGKENTIATGSTLQYYRGDKTWQTLNTSIVTELTNLYYTQARFDAAF